MSGTCSRCGRTGETEYGTDGLQYCSSCAFYGMNKQCSRCRMYLPATELQQYRGQLACPYCIQDLRDEDRKMTETIEKRPRLEVLRYPETCDRCGRDLEGRVYIWNGKRLCKRCLDDEQDTWGLARGGPMGPVQRIKVDTIRQGEKKSFIERSIGEFLALMGLKKRPISEIIIYHPKMTREIGAAKPMAETALAGKAQAEAQKTDKKPSPVAVEGLMSRDKKKAQIVPRKPVIFEEAPSEKIGLEGGETPGNAEEKSASGKKRRRKKRQA